MQKPLNKVNGRRGGGDVLAESYPHCDETHDSNRILKEAEEKFVRNDLAGAAGLANEVLHLAAQSEIQNGFASNAVQFQTLLPYFQEEYRLSVVLSSDSLDAAARASAIVLQSIAPEDDNSCLHRMLHFYSTRSMPLDLMIILIQFLVHSGQNHVAMDLAVEVLHAVKVASSSTSTTSIDEASCDELIWMIFTQMLPYCPNESYAKCFNNGSFDWQSTKAVGKWSEEPIPSILSMLPMILDSWKELVSDECLCRCHDRIRELRGDPEKNNRIECQNDVRTILSGKPSNKFFTTMNLQDWYQQLAKRMLRTVRKLILEPFSESENKWEKPSALAMTIFLGYIAWKQRRHTIRATKALANVLMGPLKEVIEAVLEK